MWNEGSKEARSGEGSSKMSWMQGEGAQEVGVFPKEREKERESGTTARS